MSSCNCNGNCYYDVETDDDITEVYNSFLSIISNTITCTTYSFIQLSIELGENFYNTSIGNRNIKTDKIKLLKIKFNHCWKMKNMPLNLILQI